ncbi:long-chain-fatty-acid--CoA ligase 1-like isoform X2 [Varroa jacobsoni]|nr:long-chain-fatty-acid--CoA ligase 1-like isoform X2 [Varroa destructor]XP_022671871.1 long-chain-fatty-acid--CoA ligase 1-like isoform X2 [Varroa destructor]XP_022701414.1 long-chain-fatty-acid--CoA ligase 1-like isoform X2 [Varroa jacobsoni]XP_022701416.1 long-chain-fatty-acid--CoA ligase 1-like isoform X2 [Varroa jacobsoni]
MEKMLRSSRFMNNMTRITTGNDRIRVCPLNVEADKELQYPRTVYEGLKNAALKNTVSNNICGWIDPVTEKLQFLSYDQFFAESKHISMAFRELGIGPKDFAAVSWINSKEFLEVMYGTTSLNMVLQPLYPNLDAHAVKYVLKQGKPKIYLCDNEAKSRLIINSATEMPFLRTLVVGRGPPSRDLRNEAQSKGIQLLGMDDFMKLGAQKNHPLAPPEPDDIFTLIYTSGTTGNPKGAIVTHECILRAYHTVSISVGPLRAHAGEYTFCYMPTGHIYEILFELLVLAEGGTAMFWRGDIKKMVDDMKIIRPHYVPMVPRIMNKIYDGVNEKLAGSKLKHAVFTYCYNKKKKLLQRGIVRNDTIYDKLVFKKIRAILGGRVASIITSSAPLSPEVMEFFKVAFGCHVSEVYGSTETLIVSGTSPYDPTGGHLGGPFPSIEIKLIDVPELGYYAKDNVGEICVRSPFVFRGYYKDKAATDNTIIDGWVVTGDVGRWTDRGTLVIIDRKKDIFKLSQGEYIAPEKVESVYARLDQIAHIFVEGRGDQRFCVAIVVPEESLFRQWIKNHGFERESELPLSDICSDIRIRKAYLEEMRNFGTAHDLGNLQQIRNLCLEVVPFTVESGLLTSTLKVKRNVARDMFAEKVDQLYREGSLVEKNV